MEYWISHVDCTQCIGRISKERGFVCPIIENIDENGSSFEIEQIRHPLVESTASRISYVKHNISLGNHHSKGWVVDGMENQH
jgi:DNA mismatch repair ATPase MutS